MNSTIGKHEYKITPFIYDSHKLQIKSSITIVIGPCSYEFIFQKKRKILIQERAHKQRGESPLIHLFIFSQIQIESGFIIFIWPFRLFY